MPRIPTYLSHSYWPEDRHVNEYFWRELFWQRGFDFTVDPKSTLLSVSHLEYTLRHSACFVGVVTLRTDVLYYQTSRYQVFEFGLAVRARKPWLVFMERGVAGQYFGEENEDTIEFRRDDNGRVREDSIDADQVEASLERLRQKAEPQLHLARPTVRHVGLLLPGIGPSGEAREGIEDLLGKAGYQVDTVARHDGRKRAPQQFLRDLDQYEFVVIDVGAPEVLPLHDMFYGRFVPMIRLRHRDSDRQPDLDVPDMLRNGLVERVVEPEIRWSDARELLPRLADEVQKLRGDRRQFASREEGLKYFRRLGRPMDWSVFVSNARADNHHAERLCRLLDLSNIRYFQYRYKSGIELGTPWREALRSELRSARIFVALITQAYLDSQICMEEWQIAYDLREQQDVSLFVYILGDMPGLTDRKLDLQAQVLDPSPTERQLEGIVEKTDMHIRLRTARRQGSGEAPIGDDDDRLSWCDDADPQIDVVLVTILQEEYEAVLRLLSPYHPVPATLQRRNRYQWVFGEVRPRDGRRPYRVVLGLAGQPGNLVGQEITRDAIEAFRPGYVLLVGIAGGIGKPNVGDVVVANYIYGYEYSTVLGDRVRLRSHWTEPTDSAMVAEALTMESRHPDWHRGNVGDVRRKGWVPRVHVGPVASGNRVIENLTNALFAPVLEVFPDLVAVEMEALGAVDAIRNARQGGHAVNFGTVRGISDLPLTEPASSAAMREGPSRDRHNDGRMLASDAAAVLAVEMIRRAWPQLPRSSGPSQS